MRANDFLGLGVSGLMSEAAEDTCITCFFCRKLPGASDSDDGRRKPPSLGEVANVEEEFGSLTSEEEGEEEEEEDGGAGETVISGILLLRFIGTGDGEGVGSISMSSAAAKTGPDGLDEVDLTAAVEGEATVGVSVA